MRIHEVLIENQLNEEILTELDWSKIKKGLAAGIISLGALGISSGAAAGDKHDNYEKQLTPAQAMQIIKQKLQQGEIKPAEVKQAVQKVDAAPEIKKAEPKVDVKPEVKKDEKPEVDKKVDSKKEKAQAFNVYYKTKEGIRNHMKDPESTKFKDLKVVKTEIDGKEYMFLIGEVNGKNGFGAYIGFKSFIALGDKFYLQDSDGAAYSDFFKKNLTGKPVIYFADY
jgi:hypothetical protein